MTTIESKKVKVNAPSNEVFTFLSDMTNFKELLPQDRITDWQATSESCSFKVQGTYKIGLERSELLPHDKLILKSGPGSPFGFVLHVNLKEVDGLTEAWQICEADLNPFIRMMVEKPLKNLFDHIADKLEAHYA